MPRRNLPESESGKGEQEADAENGNRSKRHRSDDGSTDRGGPGPSGSRGGERIVDRNAPGPSGGRGTGRFIDIGEQGERSGGRRIDRGGHGEGGGGRSHERGGQGEGGGGRSHDRGGQGERDGGRSLDRRGQGERSGGRSLDRGGQGERGGGRSLDRGGQGERAGGRSPDRGAPGPSGGRGFGRSLDRGEPGPFGRGRGLGRGGAGGQRRGRGEGRGGRRGRREEEYDMVISRPRNEDGTRQKKQAELVDGSVPVRLRANYYQVESRPDWCIYHYRVDFKPDEADTRIKKRLLKVHGPTLGAYIFDGSSLYMSHQLDPAPMILYSLRETDQETIELTVRLVAELAPTDVMHLQFLNILVRKCLEEMKLEELGRHFYDRSQAISIDAHRLELWPGYKTSIRNHEHNILLEVEITHKVLRLDNCLQVINSLRRVHMHDQRRIRNELVNTMVTTRYGKNKNYRVDDIDWNMTPMSSFDMRGENKTFMEYFRDRYAINITDPHQPMLVSRPKKRDLHRGMTGQILLVPELCFMTGLTDEMRANINLMRALATHLRTGPPQRVEKIRDFIRRIRGTPSIQEELTRWGLGLGNRLVEFDGHVLPKQIIRLGDNQWERPNDTYDWGQAFRTKPMLSSIPLKSWVIIVPSRDAHAVGKLVNNMRDVAKPLKFHIENPRHTHQLTGVRPIDYANAVDTVMNKFQGKLDMIFVILPRQVNDIYSAVKKRACIEFGVPSQCFVAKNAYNDKGIKSIATKLVVQMNAKLGGEPWSVQIPLKDQKVMIVGFDVYHCGKRKGSSFGAMVATTSPSQGKYFSTVSCHGSRDDLSEKMGADFTRCLHAFQGRNENHLPDRIFMYRDGVGDGQLKYVYETELMKILEAIERVYAGAGKAKPKFSFIVVTKRINTRIFSVDGSRPGNPGPGTVADDVITLPERYDFYLISQYSRQGTVSPTSYNVLYDTQGLDVDRMQRLTFKLCHLYFNWSGTVTVPAPCQYARKLAYLTGLSLGGPSHENLSDKLYYL